MKQGGKAEKKRPRPEPETKARLSAMMKDSRQEHVNSTQTNRLSLPQPTSNSELHYLIHFKHISQNPLMEEFLFDVYLIFI